MSESWRGNAAVCARNEQSYQNHMKDACEVLTYGSVCTCVCAAAVQGRTVEVNEPHSGGFKGEISSKGDLQGSSLTLYGNKQPSLALLACPASFGCFFFFL